MADFKRFYFNNNVANLHVLVAVFFGVVLFNSGEVFKYLLAPYVAYLMIYKREEHMPGLMLLMSYGTVLTIFAGFIAIILSIYRRSIIRNAEYGVFWKILLAMLPYYLYITYSRLSSGMAITEALQMLDIYMAFWFILYGVMNFDVFTRRMLNYFLVPLVLLLELYVLDVNMGPGITMLFRITVWTEAVLLLTAYKAFTRELSLKRMVFIRLATLIFIPTRIYMFSSYKFTFLVGFLISFLFLYKRENFLQFYPEYLRMKLRRIARFAIIYTFGFLIVGLILTPIYVSRYEGVDLSNYFSGNSSLIDVVLGKLFVDRGVLWLSVIEGIASAPYYFPPLEVPKINLMVLLESSKAMEVDFESHNTMLEMIRTQGIIFGAILTVLLLLQFNKVIKNVVGNDPLMNIYRVTLFGIGVSVFTTGQFIVKLNASFIFMALLGALSVNKDAILLNKSMHGMFKKFIG